MNVLMGAAGAGKGTQGHWLQQETGYDYISTGEILRDMATPDQKERMLAGELLEDDEIAELGLEAEGELCSQSGLQFLQFPVPDRGVPSSISGTSQLVSGLVEELQADRGVGIHCRIGVGRSAVIAACVLAQMGLPFVAAWTAIQRARGLSVPDTDEQRVWVSEWYTLRQMR